MLPDQEAGSRSDTTSRDFDRVNWIHVKAVKPRCGKPCEDCVRRQLVSPGDKKTPGILMKANPAIEPTSDAPPRLAAQGIEAQPRGAGVVERERRSC